MNDAEVQRIIRVLLAREEPAETTPRGIWDSGLNDAIAALKPADRAGRCVQAALHLWNDDLKTCHEMIQDDPDEYGAYLHAVMHRREPDPDNSKYWWRRVGRHPLFPQLLEAAKELARDGPELGGIGRDLAGMKEWDPLRHVDWTAASPAGDAARYLRALQAIELQALTYYWVGRRGT
jgi:hypothetical protein